MFLKLLATLLVIGFSIRGISSQCDDPMIQSAFCPIGVAENPFISPVPNKVPTANMVKHIGVTQSEMRFSVPFCRNCGFFFTFGKRVDAFSNPKLIRDSKFSSLSDEMMDLMDRSWNTFWDNGGTSLCSTRAIGKPFGMWKTNTTFSSQTVVSHCEYIQAIGFPTISDLNDNPDIFTKTVTPDKIEYRGNLYIHAVYPFDLEDERELYSTSVASTPVRISYPLFTRFTMTEELFTSKEILVTTSENLPFVLEVHLSLIPNAYSTYLDTDSCKVVDSGFGMEIRSVKSNLGEYSMVLSSNKQLENYQGNIDISCKAFEWVSDGSGQRRNDFPDPVKVNLNVNHARPKDIITTSRFYPDLNTFTGNENPFTEIYNAFEKPLTNRVKYVSFGIKSTDSPSTYELKIHHLKICAPSCSDNLESKLNFQAITDGELVPELKVSHNPWIKVWNEDDMVAFGSLYPGSPIYEYRGGWSISTETLMSYKYTKYMFEIELRWIPKGAARSLNSNDDFYESATILKQFILVPDEEAHSSKWYQDKDVIISMSLGSSAVAIAILGSIACIMGFFTIVIFWQCKRRFDSKPKE